MKHPKRTEILLFDNDIQIRLDDLLLPKAPPPHPNRHHAVVEIYACAQMRWACIRAEWGQGCAPIHLALERCLATGHAATQAALKSVEAVVWPVWPEDIIALADALLPLMLFGKGFVDAAYFLARAISRFEGDPGAPGHDAVLKAFSERVEHMMTACADQGSSSPAAYNSGLELSGSLVFLAQYEHGTTEADRAAAERQLYQWATMLSLALEHESVRKSHQHHLTVY